MCHEALMVVTSMSLIKLFPIWLVLYINLCSMWDILNKFLGEVWIQAGTHLTQSDGLQNSIDTARSVGMA